MASRASIVSEPALSARPAQRQGYSVDLPNTPADAVVHETPPLLMDVLMARPFGLDLRYGGAPRLSRPLRQCRHESIVMRCDLRRSGVRRRMIVEGGTGRLSPERSGMTRRTRRAPRHAARLAARGAHHPSVSRRCSTWRHGRASVRRGRGTPEPSLLLRMLLVMLFAQSAIGVTNDICDRELDAATKPWKPIASGLVRAAVAAVTRRRTDRRGGLCSPRRSARRASRSRCWDWRAAWRMTSG